MLYSHNIKEAIQPIKEIVEKCIESAKSNEKNTNDLLWVILDAHYYPNRQYRQPEGVSDYEINNLDIVESKRFHFKFIRNYFEKYQIDKKIDLGNELQANLMLMNETESLVHYEMLLYLKIWEMDSVWTYLYQLLQLSKGKDYNWYLKIVPSTRNLPSTDTLKYKTKDDLRRDIHDANNEISQFIDSVFDKNLRNAIAHSQFSLSNMEITLSNDSVLKTISFDDWSRDYFSKTILFYKALEETISNYRKEYESIAISSGGLDCIIGDNTIRNMKYTPEFWHYIR